MTTILQSSPGQQVLITLEILNSSGTRTDGYISPVIERVFFPNLSTSSIFPLPMSKLDVGLYYLAFQLPTGAAAVGSYLVDGYWVDQDRTTVKNFLYQILVSAPSGNFSASPL